MFSSRLKDSLFYAVVAATFVFALTTDAAAGDWPQILGPHRNGQADDESLADRWPKSGPKPLWQHKVGRGHAGPAVAGDRVVIFHRLGDEEVAEALSVTTGKPYWKQTFPARFAGQIFPDQDGPLCVPLIHRDKVFLFGAGGDLHAVALATGKKIWSRALNKEYRKRGGQIDYGYFGVGSTPIMVGDQLMVNVGGFRDAGIVALAAATGKTIWKATEEGPSYSSPVAAKVDGVQHVIFITRLNTLSIDPNGKVLFRFPFGKRGPTVNGATPLVVGNELFVSASYGVGAKMAKFGGSSAKIVWESDDVLSSQYNSSVYRDGHLYGVDGRADVGTPVLRCIDFKTGRPTWSQDNFDVASLILAGDKLLIMRSDGELILARASSDAYQPLAKAQLFDSKVRALPALSDGRFLARDAAMLKCYRLASESATSGN